MWKAISKKVAAWQVGLVAISLLAVIRLAGGLQFLEWMALDSLLRLRPAEPQDKHIVIVGIDQEDVQRAGTYPLPDREIAQLIGLLRRYQPVVIGLDIVRDVPLEPGSQELEAVFSSASNLIAVEKALPPEIAPPRRLPPTQVGFSDISPDADGRVRRSFLGVWAGEGEIKEFKFSLALRLSQVYLESQTKHRLDNSLRDPKAMSFSSTELPRVLPYSGGYVRADIFDVQTLLNYRSGRDPFRVLSMRQIIEGDFNPSWLKDRIVIIGITDASIRRIVNTVAIADLELPGQIAGVEFQAHATSQIISGVLEGRPLLKTVGEGWEYLWIIGWGILGIGIGQLTPSSLRNLLIVGLLAVGLILLCFALLWSLGWWIPLVPALLVFTINGIAYTAFYQNSRTLIAIANERQRTIERTFNIIHNGPLQTLAAIRRRVQDQKVEQSHLLKELTNLNSEIRAVGEYLQREAINQENSLYLQNEKKLDLKLPVHELFYAVFSSTLERDLPAFNTLKVKVRNFEPLDNLVLNVDHKRQLCRFLEESLCNVGKHAYGATRLSAIGSSSKGRYVLCITDNGPGLCSDACGQGTKAALVLKKQLRGEFIRESLSPRGTRCEFSFPLTQSWFHQLLTHKLKLLKA